MQSTFLNKVIHSVKVTLCNLKPNRLLYIYIYIYIYNAIYCIRVGVKPL